MKKYYYSLSDMEKMFPLDPSVDNRKIRLLWELQLEKENVLLKMNNPEYCEHIISFIKNDKELGLARNIESEIVEFLFLNNENDEVLNIFLPHLGHDLVLSKIEFDILVYKRIINFPNIVKNFYSDEKINEIHDSVKLYY